MGEVDFSNVEQLTNWLKHQSPERQCLLASRAALRVFANFQAGRPASLDQKELPLLRACLVSICRGALSHETPIDWASLRRPSFNDAYAITDFEKVPALTGSAKAAAEACALSYTETAPIAILSAINSASSAAFEMSKKDALKDAYSDRAVAHEQAIEALMFDYHADDELLKARLWGRTEPPVSIQANHESCIQTFSSDPAWAFWLRFYNGVWQGTFSSWDLALQVALIPDGFWNDDDDGPALAKVAREIERIEEELRQAQPPVAVELRPDNVTHLFEHAPQVRASLTLSATTLTERYGLFHKMACPNEVIPLFEPLRALPLSLARASNYLAQGAEAEEELKDEIAVLRGLIATLEKELVAAKAEIENLKQKPWYKSAWVLGGGSVIGAVLSTAWLVSGDELGPQKRWNMLSDYWDFVVPEEEEAPPLHYELPDTWDV